MRYCLKNQRRWVGKYLRENLGGNLDIYRNAAFLTLDTDDFYGNVHPRDAQISESVLIVCAEIQRQLTEGQLELQEDECIASVSLHIRSGRFPRFGHLSGARFRRSHLYPV